MCGCYCNRCLYSVILHAFCHLLLTAFLKMAVRNGCACILVVGVSEIVEEALSRQAVSEK